MRVLHLLGSDEDTGGVLSTVRNVQEATRSEGCHHISWVNSRFRQTRDPALDLRFSEHLVMETPNYLEFLRRGMRAFAELRHLLEKEPCDILHAHSRGPLIVVMLAALRLPLPVVFTNHAYARQRWFYRSISHWPRLVTTVLTPRMASFYGLREKPGRIEVISECCADSFFASHLVERPIQTPRSTLRLVGIGNVIRWKKWELVIRAIAALSKDLQRRLTFEHFGPVPADADSRKYSEELKHLIATFDITSRIQFNGPSGSVEKVLATADWFVLPSTNEPCSVALIEALALGVPALVTASGGNPDLVRDSTTGALFTPDDPGSLATRLVEILEGKLEAITPAQIRETVRSRSATSVGLQFMDLYRRALQRHAS